ncbi:calcineurin-like phosphoesterase domain-containing protein [Rhizobium sp. Kim5]|uniref:metallophosphoesterase n=1 Tax=Rhizobium sp. Kim5 TaxID=2020311 RepID=UPI000A29FE73|nr:metallophosphoesterase [Rhizobium sp. Kim5]ARQ58952.1 calcineurin-like phosphoesterase domain-containing protein [Rhizobium sp. Kim5]
MLLLHLSDIHFNNRDIEKPYDQNLGLRDDTINDIKTMREKIGRDVDAILISGDIAYHGQQFEYEYAAKWLEEDVCAAAGCAFENIFVIPGNHDVDRKAAAEPIHEDARRTLRATDVGKSNAAIKRYVDSEASSEMLFKPIENYNRFAAKFLCEVGFHQKDTGQKPYARRDFLLNDKSTLRLWGFNSVLVCDADDDVNKMFVDPSAAEIIKRDDGVTHLVMCHHPFNWLRNSEEFQGRIDAVAKLHLFGHEHSLRVEEYRKFTRIKAGALHPDRDEGRWQPGYNFIDLSVSGPPDKRVLQIKLWVRHLFGTRYIAAPDEEGNDPWELHHDLRPWSPPQEPVAAVNEVAVAPAACKGGAMVGPAPTVRSVAIKILALREFDQRKIITELNLHQDGDQRLADYAFAIAAVRRAEARGDLVRLNDVIDKYSGARN